MNAEQLVGLMQGYQLSQSVFVAVQLGVLDALAEARAAEELFATVDIDRERGQDLLDILASVGVLLRQGERYRTAPEIHAALDENLPGLPGTLRSLVTHHAKYRYERWGHLLETVRTGRRPPFGTDGFSGFHETPADLAANTNAMFDKSLVWGAALAEKFDFSGRASYLDVGGAAGAMSIAVARRWPQLRCMSADLPRLEPFAQERIGEACLAERVRFVACDFLKDVLPAAEVISFASVFHNWDRKTRDLLVAKSARALPAGGHLLICENFLDEARDNTEQLLGSFNMAVMTDGGSEFSARQLAAALARAGFAHLETRRLVRHAQVAIFRRA